MIERMNKRDICALHEMVNRYKYRNEKYAYTEEYFTKHTEFKIIPVSDSITLHRIYVFSIIPMVITINGHYRTPLEMSVTIPGLGISMDVPVPNDKYTYVNFSQTISDVYTYIKPHINMVCVDKEKFIANELYISNVLYNRPIEGHTQGVQALIREFRNDIDSIMFLGSLSEIYASTVYHTPEPK